MYINKIGINKINFQANYITITKLRGEYLPTAVSTDNEENLGTVLQYERDGYKYEKPMEYDGKYYTSIPATVSDKYRIYYKDTHQYERGGQVQVIDTPKLIKAAMEAEKIFNNNFGEKSLEKVISKGEVKGRLFVNTFDIPKNVPAILILEEVKKEEDILLLPKNVRGIIVSSANLNILDHIACLARNKYLMFSIVRDNEKFNNLKNKEGKYLSLNNSSGVIKYKEIEPNDLDVKPVSPTKITLPRLENVERLLDYDELTPQNCGNKGYRLGVMQRLVRDGVLKNINIPKGFVIPNGYINKLLEYIDVGDENERDDLLFDGIYTQEVDKKVEDLGMNKKNLIIRSNFNDEDLDYFSSAGVHNSFLNYDQWILDTALNLIYDFKNFKLEQYVHNNYEIDDSQIQPSVIVQDNINKDFAFTVYTDDGDNNIIIQLSSFGPKHEDNANAMLKYNKKTKELKIERKHYPYETYLFDEKGNIVSQKHPADKILMNWDNICSLLNIVTDGALVLEQYFKHPQDIEGGIDKDGKVYFWQTRNIVTAGKKRI